MNKNDNLSTIIQKIQSKIAKSVVAIDGGYIPKDKRLEQKISFFKNKELLAKYNNHYEWVDEVFKSNDYYKVFVMDDNKIIAGAIIRLVSNKICCVLVDDDYSGNGIAKLLIQMSEHLIGTKPIYTTTDSTSILKKYLLKNGYEITGLYGKNNDDSDYKVEIYYHKK